MSARPMNLRFALRLALAAGAGAALAACSWTPFESKGIEYKSAGKLPPLEVPPDLARPSRDDRYLIPETPAPSSATASGQAADRQSQPIRASGLDVLPNVEGLRIARAGTERWLVVPLPPDRIWPMVKEFWQDNGFLLKVEQPEVGVMETDWAENRAKIPNDGIRSVIGRFLDSAYSTGERDKFRTRMERGAEPNTTEIYVSHRGMVEQVVNTTRGSENTIWQPRAPDPELEAEFLRRLMVRLGADDARAKSQIAAARAPERAKLVSEGGGAGSLQLTEPFDRAWRRVGLALDRVGFTVEDRDRSKGYYFVRYVDPATDERLKRDTGFLSRLAFWRSNDPKPNPNEQYRVLVQGSSDDSSRVQVLGKDGAAENSDTAKRILGLLHDQLK